MIVGDWHRPQAMGEPVSPPSQTDVQATPGGLADTSPLGFGGGLGCAGVESLLNRSLFGAGGSLHFFAVTAQMRNSKGPDHSVMVWRRWTADGLTNIPDTS